MAKKESQLGYAKLLDAWQRPDSAGDPIGCVATSFTFSPVFFEEECLARFLSLESDPIEDGPAYIIEREEKLAPVSCAAAIVDQHHCVGERSLRWDLLSARVPGGLLHAKISILCWSNLVRLIVASANLTEDGYRRNLEVFGVLDYQHDGDAPETCLEELVSFVRRIAGTGSSFVSPSVARVNRLLDWVLELARPWAVEESARTRQPMKVYSLVVAPEEDDAFAKLGRLWPGGGRPTHGSILSPFFDPPAPVNRPARGLWELLNRKGEATVSLCTLVEPISDSEGFFVRAPESILHSQPSGRNQVETRVCGVELEATRPLHAKGIRLSNEQNALYMVGSSNFTSAGLGLARNPNFEANLVYVLNQARHPKAAKALDAAFPPNNPLNLSSIRWQPFANEDEATDSELAPLPEAFAAATYDRVGDVGHVVLTFGADPPSGWRISDEQHDFRISSELNWNAEGKPEAFVVQWPHARPPSGFWVRWDASAARAWWPVNVARTSVLPPPEELKNLPLEVLINILTSARPLHRALGEYLKLKLQRNGEDTSGPIIDPHKKVDTSQFLLQRTRRVSWGLSALRVRLERPVSTEECLDWRLRGPVGVKAVAQAILREARSQEEKAFLLSELALELARVVPPTVPGYLPSERVREALRELILELRDDAKQNSEDIADNLKMYVSEVFKCIAP